MERAGRKATAEEFFSKEWAVLKMIEKHVQVMKFAKHVQHATLAEDFCLLSYRMNLAGQIETLKHIPRQYWQDFAFCLRMTTESPACLRYTPTPTRNVFRKVYDIEWLKFEDEMGLR